MGANGGFEIDAQPPAGPTRPYLVRCLPPDFPKFRFRAAAAGTRRPRYFVIAPSFGTLRRPFKRYMAIFDSRLGIPLWWDAASVRAINATVLPDGNIAWFDGIVGHYQERHLDGELVRELGTNGAESDHHEIQELPNGDYLLDGAAYRRGVDETAYGGPASAKVQDGEIEEVTPSGRVVWRWSTADHIRLRESARWLNAGHYLDLVHLNSISAAGRMIVVSLRHTDAVYGIDRATGKIAWKLGGTHTRQSLRVVGDPHRRYPFRGQHDARIWADGTLSVFDNEYPSRRHPRVVRYRLNLGKRTAKLIESIHDRRVRHAGCCGSARRLPGGGWLINWGEGGYTSGYTAAGEPTFTLRFPHLHEYRATPVSSDLISRAKLWRDMNALARRRR